MLPNRVSIKALAAIDRTRAPTRSAHRCSPPRSGRARRAQGLWASASGGVLDAADARAVAQAAGYTIVEGRIASIGRAAGRIYFDFGKRRGVDLSIVLSSRNISQFEEQGVAPDRLVGHRIRARGLIDRRSGPSIEIVSPDAFEILDAREQENPPVESGER